MGIERRQAVAPRVTRVAGYDGDGRGEGRKGLGHQRDQRRLHLEDHLLDAPPKQQWHKAAELQTIPQPLFGMNQ